MMTDKELAQAAWNEVMESTISGMEWQNRVQNGYKGKPYNWQNTSFGRAKAYLEQIGVEIPPDPAPPATDWTRGVPSDPISRVTNAPTLGLNVNNVVNGNYRDYIIDGTGDSGILAQGTTSKTRFERIELRRIANRSAVTWAKHGIYCKARGNVFTDILAENGGNAVSGFSVRMGNNNFTRTVVFGFTHAVTYYEHDGEQGVVTFHDGDWQFTGDTAIWGDDSNEPPTPYIKQVFNFENVKASGPGKFFLKFGGTTYRGPGVNIKGCTLNSQPVNAAMVSGVPTHLLNIS